MIDFCLSLHLLLAMLLLSLVSFLQTFYDKRAAISGKSRLSESNLLFVSLAGGWPGSLAAQSLFRHKTRKKSFRLKFIVTVIASLSLYGFLLANADIVYSIFPLPLAC